MKLTKKQFIFYIILGVIVTSGIILSMVEDFQESKELYDSNFKKLGGCEECGDVLVKCNNGSYEIVKNDNQSLKVICGNIISMSNK